MKRFLWALLLIAVGARAEPLTVRFALDGASGPVCIAIPEDGEYTLIAVVPGLPPIQGVALIELRIDERLAQSQPVTTTNQFSCAFGEKLAAGERSIEIRVAPPPSPIEDWITLTLLSPGGAPNPELCAESDEALQPVADEEDEEDLNSPVTR